MARYVSRCEDGLFVVTGGCAALSLKACVFTYTTVVGASGLAISDLLAACWTVTIQANHLPIIPGAVAVQCSRYSRTSVCILYMFTLLFGS